MNTHIKQRVKNYRFTEKDSSSDEELDNKEEVNSSLTVKKMPPTSENFARLNEQAVNAIKAGKISDSLIKYQSSLDTLSKLHGVQSTDFIVYFTKTVEELNSIAMNYLKKSDIESTHEILGWCETVLEPGVYGEFSMLRNTTYNNLGCLYRRVGQLQNALKYLNAALDIIENDKNSRNQAKTYLNLCAVLSEMGNHDEAAVNAKNALIYAQEELLQLKEAKGSPALVNEKVTMLAIAYHNMGIEDEYMNKLESSIKWYQKSLQVLEENETNSYKLAEKFAQSLETARIKLIESSLRGSGGCTTMSSTVSGRSSFSGGWVRTSSFDRKILTTNPEIKQEKKAPLKKTLNYFRPPTANNSQVFMKKNRIVQKQSFDLGHPEFSHTSVYRDSYQNVNHRRVSTGHVPANFPFSRMESHKSNSEKISHDQRIPIEHRLKKPVSSKADLKSSQKIIALRK